MVDEHHRNPALKALANVDTEDPTYVINPMSSNGRRRIEVEAFSKPWEHIIRIVRHLVHYISPCPTKLS